MGDGYQQTTAVHAEKALLMFGSVFRALEAERVLKDAAISCELLVPPLELRTGCDLAVALEGLEVESAREALTAAGLTITDERPSSLGSAQLSDVVTAQEFQNKEGTRYVMVRAGNMKITVQCDTGRIVNISGGGCPDIPYLNISLVGKSLGEAPRPRNLGKTLCGLMLDRAFLEACDRCGVMRDEEREA